jgi:uridine kinase
MTTLSQGEILRCLASRICTTKLPQDRQPHPVRVAIDGVDAAGKTTLADRLAGVIEKQGRPVIRASIDGFHNPRRIRYQQGSNAPQGYYHDSFNYEILLRDLLIPLGPAGNRTYRCQAFHLHRDTPSHDPWQIAPENSILLFDGIFLLRPELTQYWDYSIYLDVDFNVSVPRAIARDCQKDLDHNNVETIKARYDVRYVPGQQIYLQDANPKAQASIIIDNNDFRNPFIIYR